MKTLLFLFAFILIHPTTLSQITRTYLVVSDNGSGSDTLWFGYAPGATCGVDSFIPCESELPPPPPSGVFDARWLLCHPGQGAKCDIRGYVDPSDIDTHKVKVQPSDAGYPVRFHWNHDSIRAICDSAWLQDEFGGVIFRIRMHIVDSSTLVSPAFSSALLIRFGQRPPVSVEAWEQPPFAFQLHQNYPNPFNPTTTISFLTHHSSIITLKVFNLLGREVATLVDKHLLAGEHSVTFNGEGLASGVYIYTLRADGSSQSRKMIVLR